MVNVNVNVSAWYVKYHTFSNIIKHKKVVKEKLSKVYIGSLKVKGCVNH